MSRAQQSDTFKTSQEQNQTNEANSQKTQATEQADISSEKSNLAKFAADNPYIQGGAFQTAQNQTIADAANASAEGAKASAQNQAERTGQNPAAANAAAEAAAQNAQRVAAGQQGEATTSRLASGAKYNQLSLEDQDAITKQEEQLASLQSGAAQGALGTQEEAAKTPSFLDQIGSGLIQGGVAVGTAYCPAEGSLYLMSDGTEIPVELLCVGDLIAGIDGAPQKIEMIESAVSPVLLIHTDDGHRVRNSMTHAFALPFGGFTVACKSLGKTIRTRNGCASVISVDRDGEARVYNVITDGSHTYRADGVWALGVGEAERRVSMDEWNRIAEQMAVR